MVKTWRITVCGQSACGKTAILEHLLYANQTPNSVTIPTIEDIYMANIETDKGLREKVRFVDTAGLNASKPDLPKHYILMSDGFVLVYDVTNQESFSRLEFIKREIDKHRDKKDKEVNILVLGCKTDLEDKKIVDIRAAQKWAEDNKMKLFEVTITDRKSLTDAFCSLVSKLAQQSTKYRKK